VLLFIPETLDDDIDINIDPVIIAELDITELDIAELDTTEGLLR